MKTTAIAQRWSTFIYLTVLSLAVLTLGACGGGGGGGGGGGAGQTPGATPTAGLSNGMIEGFGSVIVNGVKFEVEGAEVEFEHGTTVVISGATQTLHLNEGMQVEVEGSFDDNGRTGTATRIRVDDELEGEIAAGSMSVNGVTGILSFSILGQTVLAVPGVTFIDDSSPLNGQLANLAEGQFVEVHGLPDGAGTIQATFIEYKAADQASFDLSGEGELELTGAISAMTSATLFTVGSQQIDAGSATIDGPLAVGTLVEVKGTLSGSTLMASLVHVEDGLANQAAKVEIEGLVRNLDTPTAGQFSLNGQQVDYTGATFMGGVQADLINGLKVEAEGPIASGLLLATKVKFKDSFRYEGAMTELNPNSYSIDVPGGATLTLLVDPAIARIDAGLDPTTRNLKVRARIASGSTLVATRLSDGGNLDGRQIFEAPVVDFSLAADSVELLDNGSGLSVGLINVDTSTINDINHPSGSDFQIEDRVVSKAAFYQALNVGDRVKARYDNGSWDQIEIELEN